VPRHRLPAALLAALVSTALLAGCASSDWTKPHPAPTAVGAVKSGFVPETTPSPEATVEPAPGSWDGVHPSPGMRVVLLSAGDDRPTKTLRAAITKWADAEDVDLRTVRADDQPIDGVVRAMEHKPDLIVTAGNGLIDALAVVSANHGDQKFLIIGAEVAEPTENVTAVDWTGASFRGEGLGMSSSYDAASFTAERCGRGIRAGIAAVLTGMTGVVLWID
jgi:basic membrane lipoprotein Med (substrate-binding protein (PBP1-ABC) superfamily)